MNNFIEFKNVTKGYKIGCIINSVGECKFTTLFLFIKKDIGLIQCN